LPAENPHRLNDLLSGQRIEWMSGTSLCLRCHLIAFLDDGLPRSADPVVTLEETILMLLSATGQTQA